MKLAVRKMFAIARLSRRGAFCHLLSFVFSCSVLCGAYFLCASSGSRMTALPACLFLAALVGIIWSARTFDRSLGALADRIESRPGMARPTGLSPASVLDRLSQGLDTVLANLDSVGHRAPHRHGVTGLPTREPLMEALGGPFESEAKQGLLGIVELLDFDRLSAFDNAAADRILNRIAERIVRMVGQKRVVAHIDRARIAIWFEGLATAELRAEFDAICYALRNQIAEPGVSVLPQIRSGSAIQTCASVAPSELLGRAIADLSGGGPHMVFASSEDPREVARQTYNFEQDLRQAIARNQFELWFQPFVDAAEQRICGAEALLRWRHPEHGLISPALFVPIVEAAGLAEEVGLWTLNVGCREARLWQRHGKNHNLKVAVNLSAHQLERDELDALISRTLSHHGLSPGLLEIELTETVAALDSSSAKTLFEKLRALGVSISIDDFGAGYSSLSYLKKLSFDKLKIDREFVSEVDRHRDSQAICQSIVALGRGLGISVLAEGVERQEEYIWLRHHGCTLFQGFYFSRPVEASRFLPLVSDHDRIRKLTDLGPSALQQRLTTKG